MANIHEISNFLWNIADDVLRDDFKRSKYPDIILPFVVLCRLDSVLAPTKKSVLLMNEKLKAANIQNVEGQLRHSSGYAFFNISNYDINKLLDDPQNIAKNLRDYINGFSENIRDILDKFKIRNTIDELDKNGLLYMLVQKFVDPKVDLHPDSLNNHDMGYVFEELIRRFNEQLNENPGEHFTPREVIKLMVKLVLNGDKNMLSQQAIVRTVYDPACGTGGMLSIAKRYIVKEINDQADIHLFGQEVNPETYAVCKSDLLIKGQDRDAENIKQGTTLSDDGHIGRTFDYQVSNPPYGKTWKKDKSDINRERRHTYNRFSAGVPRISDGQMLFLQHMISKMKPISEGGGRLSIVMNGSPLFTGDAGSGESEIRRWILENDWLETIIALPSQLFYNTGIHTYIWVLSNRKTEDCKGKVLLINGAALEKVNDKETEVFAQKMRKSLGDKRNELSTEHIDQLAQLAADFSNTDYAKIFDNTYFGYRKITVERPLRLNFQVSPERIDNIKTATAFINLAISRKKDPNIKEKDETEGKKHQEEILTVLEAMDGDKIYRNRERFIMVLKNSFKELDVSLSATLKKAIITALSQRDEEADICTDARGNPEPDPDLRDYERVPLNEDIYEYFAREVTHHVPDAWINEAVKDHKDLQIGKVGYEINFNRYFYRYEPPRPLEEIDADIRELEEEIMQMLQVNK